MREALTSMMLLTGSGFALVAAIGLLRMPDLFTRMHAATKTGTLGVGCTALAVAIYFENISITLQAIMIIVLLFLTAPIAAHMIGRAAYLVQVPLGSGTVVDELEGQYDPERHVVRNIWKR